MFRERGITYRHEGASLTDRKERGTNRRCANRKLTDMKKDPGDCRGPFGRLCSQRDQIQMKILAPGPIGMPSMNQAAAMTVQTSMKEME